MTEELRTQKIKRELTKEEKKERNRAYYLKFIERCRNHEFVTKEERKTTPGINISPEEKKEAIAIRRRLATKIRRLKNPEEWNNYMRTYMREKYRNNEPHRIVQCAKAKIRRDLKKAASKAQNLTGEQQQNLQYEIVDAS